MGCYNVKIHIKYNVPVPAITKITEQNSKELESHHLGRNYCCEIVKLASSSEAKVYTHTYTHTGLSLSQDANWSPSKVTIKLETQLSG